MPSPGLVVRSSQNLGEELLGTLRLWVVDDLGGSSGLDDHSAVHKNDLIGDLAGEPDFVGNDRHRHAGGGQILHDLENLADEFGIKRGRGLVEEHDLRIHRQRAGNRHTLLLAPESSAG